MQGKIEIGEPLMTGEDLAELKASLDLPGPVVDFLSRQPLLTMTYDAGAVTFLSVIFYGLAAVLFFAPVGVLFFDNPGQLLPGAEFLRLKFLFTHGSRVLVAALTIAGLGGALLSYLLYRLSLRLSPSLYFKSIASFLYPSMVVYYRRRPKFEWPGGDLARWLLRGIKKDLPPKEYLRRAESRFLVLLGCSALVLYEMAAGLIAFDIM